MVAICSVGHGPGNRSAVIRFLGFLCKPCPQTHICIHFGSRSPVEQICCGPAKRQIYACSTAQDRWIWGLRDRLHEMALRMRERAKRPGATGLIREPLQTHVCYYGGTTAVWQLNLTWPAVRRAQATGRHVASSHPKTGDVIGITDLKPQQSRLSTNDCVLELPTQREPHSYSTIPVT